VAFKIGERNPRYCDPEALAAEHLLTLWGGHLFLDNVTRRTSNAKRLDYAEFSFEGGQIQFHRVIAGAGRGETVRLASEHHDLRMQSLEIIPGSAQGTAREDVLQAALCQYHAAVNRGAWPPLSASAYKALVRGIFKVLDDTHGQS
jgi:hypothetical protein